MNGTFREYKDEMIRRGINCKHFTKKFFLAYSEAVKAARANAENGINDTYTGRVWLDPVTLSNPIILRHSYDAVYNSDFYIRNGAAYCQFLEVVNAFHE